jgi:hypothetical protein
MNFFDRLEETTQHVAQKKVIKLTCLDKSLSQAIVQHYDLFPPIECILAICVSLHFNALYQCKDTRLLTYMVLVPHIKHFVGQQIKSIFAFIKSSNFALQYL